MKQICCASELPEAQVFLWSSRPGLCLGAGFCASMKASHPPIQICMGANPAAQVLAFRAVSQAVFPPSEFDRGLAFLRVKSRRTFIGGNPPILSGTCLLLAADVARETLYPHHRVLCYPVWKTPRRSRWQRVAPSAEPRFLPQRSKLKFRV